MSWNVNGLKAWSKRVSFAFKMSSHSNTRAFYVALKGYTVDYIKREDPDICCLQETKCDKDNIPEVRKFQCTQ